MGDTTEKKDRIKQLKKNIKPPPNLEEKIVMKLKSHELLSSNEKKTHGFIFKISYSLGLLLIGLLIGYSINSNEGKIVPLERNSKSKFILLLYQDENLKGDENDRVKDYTLWANEYGAKRIVVAGAKLEGEGKILSMPGKNISIASIKSEYESRVTSGYFIIETANYDEAMEIALSCPHIKYGGSIEVREFARTK